MSSTIVTGHTLSPSMAAWAVKDDEDEEGSQIDLLIIRKDNMVNMYEIKFYSDDFSVDSGYSRKLARRTNALSEMLPRKMSIQSTLITTYGLKYGEYSGSFMQTVTMDDLFRF